MDVRDWILLIVAQRAVMGAVFLVIAARAALWYRDERAYRKSLGKNGIQAEILSDRIESAWRKTLRILLLTLPSFMQWVGVHRNFNAPYTTRSLVVNLFFTALMLVDVYGLTKQWMHRNRLLWLARHYEDLTKKGEG